MIFFLKINHTKRVAGHLNETRSVWIMRKISDLPDVLTAQEVADFLQISKEHVYAMIRREEIPFFKLGRLVRIPKQDFIKWIDDGGIEPSTETVEYERFQIV